MVIIANQYDVYVSLEDNNFDDCGRVRGYDHECP
jgi:hypothetical protein